ncbi:class I SAM-dependent methyltransferase [Cognatiluteimonas weifangensis]|uniref:Class I SAM-dependent methyltransferase n=1 Tax=Cognatiluteimonas weifangensis TaxID=2303539 RepID=A0A372DKD2_9GAMM|nr:class I SAM-dependent methyltransferase [Luteimonas weifangensis]RFP59964.1 class I SAM-dependent methyltransferase [Luteimonas weifangensis]
MNHAATATPLRGLRARPFRCPGCGPSLLLRLGGDEMRVRCLRCRGTPVHLSLLAALAAHVGRLAALDACELSTTGALLRHLRRRCRSVATSEYLEGITPGGHRNGIRCEDVQRLSYADASFDLCTSTEVFEHVPDDRAGLRELHRVLRPGGWLLFTVPLSDLPATRERARRHGPRIEHLLPPAYHGDRLNGPGSVLVYRDYGRDIVERVRAAGFDQAALWTPRRDFHGHRRAVVVARRG